MLRSHSGCPPTPHRPPTHTPAPPSPHPQPRPQVQYTSAGVGGAEAGGEGEAMVRSLQATRLAVDEKLDRSRIQVGRRRRWAARPCCCRAGARAGARLGPATLGAGVTGEGLRAFYRALQAPGSMADLSRAPCRCATSPAYNCPLISYLRPAPCHAPPAVQLFAGGRALKAADVQSDDDDDQDDGSDGELLSGDEQEGGSGSEDDDSEDSGSEDEDEEEVGCGAMLGTC